MSPPQGTFTNRLQTIYCAFDSFRETVSYSEKDHDLRSFSLMGFIWNTEAGAFLHKVVQAEVYWREPDTEWLAWAERQHGRTDICGDIVIAASVVPKKVENLEIEPVRISVAAPATLWRDLRQLAQSTVDAGFHVEGTFGLWSPGDKYYGLEKLDVSEEMTYPLHSFSLRRSLHRIQSPRVE